MCPSAGRCPRPRCTWPGLMRIPRPDAGRFRVTRPNRPGLVRTPRQVLRQGTLETLGVGRVDAPAAGALTLEARGVPPQVWAAWMRLLLAAPRARLWLLEFDEGAVDRCVCVGRGGVTRGPVRDWWAGPCGPLCTK